MSSMSIFDLVRPLFMGHFDISRNGEEIVFDRPREESDIVLFHLQEK
jgi:hypothetical protein